MFTIKPYESNEARVGAIEVASAIPVFALGALGGVFGGTLWGKTGFGICALAGSIFGFLASKVAKASTVEDSAEVKEGIYVPPSEQTYKTKPYEYTPDESGGFSRFGTDDELTWEYQPLYQMQAGGGKGPISGIRGIESIPNGKRLAASMTANQGMLLKYADVEGVYDGSGLVVDRVISYTSDVQPPKLKKYSFPNFELKKGIFSNTYESEYLQFPVWKSTIDMTDGKITGTYYVPRLIDKSTPYWKSLNAAIDKTVRFILRESNTLGNTMLVCDGTVRSDINGEAVHVDDIKVVKKLRGGSNIFIPDTFNVPYDHLISRED